MCAHSGHSQHESGRPFSARIGHPSADKTKILPFIEVKKDRTSSFSLIHINSIGFVWFMLKFEFCFSRALIMTRNIVLTWLVSIASLSLLAAVAVYCVARIYPPEILTPIQAVNTELAAQTAAFGSAPSFFYTLALGLFISACASTLTNARVHPWYGYDMLRTAYRR
jgi:hypothetical protein